MDEPADKQFNENEADLILKRAAELESQTKRDEFGRNLSLPDLEQVAREAQIDPAMVRLAAEEVETRPIHPIVDESPAGLLSKLAGSPLTFSVDRIIEIPLTDDIYNRAVDLIERTFHKAGTSSGSGSFRKWSSNARGELQRWIAAVFSSTQSATHIRLEEEVRSLAGWFVTAGIVGGGGLVVLVTSTEPLRFYVTSAWTGIPLVLAGMAAGLLLARGAVARTVSKRRSELENLVEKIAGTIQS